MGGVQSRPGCPSSQARAHPVPSLAVIYSGFLKSGEGEGQQETGIGQQVSLPAPSCPGARGIQLGKNTAGRGPPMAPQVTGKHYPLVTSGQCYP